MSLIASLGAIEIGLIFGLVALGVYLSFRVLNFPDLTVDGSFPLGGAVAAALIVGGIDPFARHGARPSSAGAAAGLVTAWLNVRFSILQLLASILTMIALYSINLRIMGQPNVALIDDPTVFTPFESAACRTTWLQPLVLLVIVDRAKLLIDLFFASRGRARHARHRRQSAHGAGAGHPTDRQTICSAWRCRNGLVALAGALFAQSHGGADVTMGIGTIVVGLAAVIIGETLLPARSLVITTAGAASSARCSTASSSPLALKADFLGLQAQDLNLVTAVLVAVALLVPAYSASGQAAGRLAQPAPSSPRRPDHVAAQGLEVTFNPGTPIENRALRGIDLTIPTGQFVTVIGSNGAGKSTLLNAVSGDLWSIAADPIDGPGRHAPSRRWQRATWWRACSRTRWPAPARR